MSTTQPADQPITTATLRRLLIAAAVGCTLVAAASLALTAGLGTPTAGVFAAVASAVMFAGMAFDIIETRAARRAALVPAAAPAVTTMTGGVLQVDSERAAERLAMHAAFATIVVDAGIVPVLDRWLDEELKSGDVARAAVEALLAEPELLDNLAEFVIAVGSIEPADVDGQGADEPAAGVDVAAPEPAKASAP